VPSADDVTLRSAPVALFLMETVAFGRTAPEGSVTNPEIVPTGACANPVVTRNANKQTQRKLRKRIMLVCVGEILRILF
jgi:hypothetical protein